MVTQSGIKLEWPGIMLNSNMARNKAVVPRRLIFVTQQRIAIT
jgi:hypothetical protein